MKKLFIIITVLLLLLCLNVFASESRAEIKETVITVAHVAVEGQYHPYNEGLKKMQEVLDEETGGKIKLKIYAGGSLSNDEKEMLTMIKSGLLDMAIIAPSPLSTYEPTLSILGLPYIFNSMDHAEKVMSGEVGHIIQQMLEKKGFTILSWWIGKGFRSVNNSVRPIYKPEDFKGIKIRVMQDPAYIDTFKAFGAIPVPISWGELHTALQTKTVDAHENDPQVIDKYGFIEFTKYFSLTEHTLMPIAVVISSNKLNSLGEEGKKVLLKAADVARHAARKVADNVIEESYKGIEAQGGVVNKVDSKEDFQKVALPVIEKYKAKFGEEGAYLIELILK
jgi:tripartite ATP-independent transporter DctP family solute receptor